VLFGDEPDVCRSFLVGGVDLRAPALAESAQRVFAGILSNAAFAHLHLLYSISGNHLALTHSPKRTKTPF